MRTGPLLIAAPLLMLGACNVTKDNANDTTVLTVDDERVENAAEDVANAAGEAAETAGNALENAGPAIENAADTIGERAGRVGAKAENAVERVDVDVTVKNESEPDRR